jgi:ubiquitin carboxyl-terminal hydrolase MINDY-3/4
MGENEEQKQPEAWWIEVQSFKNVLWGADVKSDVFRRWAQGFQFSEDEPSALIQREGGPCAVICPVQAYLLKALLMDTPGHSFKDLTTEKCQTLLIQAISNILKKCKNDLQYRLVTVGRAGGAEQGVEAIGGAAGGVEDQPEDMVTESSQDVSNNIHEIP